MRQTVDDPGSPPLPLLSLEDLAADLPVQEHELAVDRDRREDSHRSNAGLQLLEELSVAGEIGHVGG